MNYTDLFDALDLGRPELREVQAAVAASDKAAALKALAQHLRHRTTKSPNRDRFRKPKKSCATRSPTAFMGRRTSPLLSESGSTGAQTRLKGNTVPTCGMNV